MKRVPRTKQGEPSEEGRKGPETHRPKSLRPGKIFHNHLVRMQSLGTRALQWPVHFQSAFLRIISEKNIANQGQNEDQEPSHGQPGLTPTQQINKPTQNERCHRKRKTYSNTAD